MPRVTRTIREEVELPDEAVIDLDDLFSQGFELVENPDADSTDDDFDEEDEGEPDED